MSGQVRRKRTERTGYRAAILTVSVVVGCLAFVVNLRVNTLKQKEELYHEREQSLIAQVAEQEDRAQKLEEYRIYVQTKQYIEEVAKEKLGLVYPDETILKPNE